MCHPILNKKFVVVLLPRRANVLFIFSRVKLPELSVVWTFLVQNSNRIVSGSVLRAVKPEKVRGSYYSCGKYDFAFAHRNELHPDAASIECLGFLTSISFASTTSVERIDFRGSPVCCGVRRSTDFRESRSDNCVCVKKAPSCGTGRTFVMRKATVIVNAVRT